VRGGFTVSDIHNTDHRRQNMSDILKRLGLDAELLARGQFAGALRSAVFRCLSCDADQACQAWLAHAPERIDRAPSWCPNSEFFAYTRGQTCGGIPGSDNIAQTALAPADDTLVDRIWSRAIILFGLALTVAWTCLLGYGLVTIIKLLF
jgi:uncharacterized protein DUF6455